MGIYYLTGSRREALHSKGEIYKRYAKQFLLLKGYVTTADSSYDGNFPDLIVQHRYSGEKYFVEVKDSKISLFNVEFADEFVRYLEMMNEDRDKGLIVVCRALSNKIGWESIVKKRKINAIEEWRDEVGEKLIKKKSRAEGIFLKSLTGNRLSSLLSKVEVYVGALSDLDRKIKQMETESVNLTQFYVDEVFKAIESSKPLRKQTKHFLNAFPIKFGSVFIQKLNFNNPKEVYQKIKCPPPFLWKKGGEIITLDSRPFEDYSEETISVWDFDDLISRNRYDAIRLANFVFKDLFKHMGLHQSKNRRDIYYFTSRNKKPLKVWAGKLKRTVISHDVKKGNLFIHHSAKMFVTLLWSLPVLMIVPTLSFSYDGYQILFGEPHKKLERKFRNPKAGYNPSIRGWTNFWYYFVQDRLEKLSTPWAKSIKISKIEFHFPFSSDPADPIDPAQTSLEDFFNGL